MAGEYSNGVTETRLGHLETTQARLDERVANVKEDVKEVRANQTAMRVELVQQVSETREAVSGQVADLRDSIAEEKRTQAGERKALKIALILLAGTIFAAIIGSVLTILLTGHG